MKMSKTLALSFLVHGLVFLGLWLMPQAHKINQHQDSIKIEVVQSQPPVSQSRPAQVTKTKGRGLTKNSALQKWKKWIPGSSQIAPPIAAQTYQGQSSDPSINDQAWYSAHPDTDRLGAEWGEGGGNFQRVQEQNFFQQLQASIENHLFYPGILARHKVSGTVNARLIFNEQGQCDFKRTQLANAERHLQIYIYDLLKKVCSRHQFASSLKHRKQTVADLSFTFDITEHNDEVLKEKQKLIVGNTLLFYRNSHQSVAEWKFGPFRGMFPIPFVNLDFDWIQEHWDSLVGNKPAES